MKRQRTMRVVPPKVTAEGISEAGVDSFENLEGLVDPRKRLGDPNPEISSGSKSNDSAPLRAAARRSVPRQRESTQVNNPVTVTAPVTEPRYPLDERLDRVLDRLFYSYGPERGLYEELLAFVAGRYPDAFAAIARWLEEQVEPLDDDEDDDLDDDLMPEAEGLEGDDR